MLHGQEDRQEGGKRPGRGALAASSPASESGRLLSLLDEGTGELLLVDTGASYSVWPHQSTAPQRGPKIVTADRRPIPCWGRESRQISAGGRTFNVSFLLAAVSFPILGMDFLETNGFDVSPRRQALVGLGRIRIPLQAPGAEWLAAHVRIIAVDEEEGIIALALSQCTDERILRGDRKSVV